MVGLRGGGGEWWEMGGMKEMGVSRGEDVSGRGGGAWT